MQCNQACGVNLKKKSNTIWKDSRFVGQTTFDQQRKRHHLCWADETCPTYRATTDVGQMKRAQPTGLSVPLHPTRLYEAE
jgi:hypothetical protein